MLRILWTEYVNKKKSIFKKTKTKSKCILTLETYYHSSYVFFRSNRCKQKIDTNRILDTQLMFTHVQVTKELSAQKMKSAKRV